jgi:hypothetical protein
MLYVVSFFVGKCSMTFRVLLVESLTMDGATEGGILPEKPRRRFVSKANFFQARTSHKLTDFTDS